MSTSTLKSPEPRPRGLPPMEYLLAWRTAIAKDLLRRYDFGLAE